jgi:transcriptional regulator with XRE-family HTH domain
MTLTVAERKHQMPSGAQREVATALGVKESFVSEVMAGEVFPKRPGTKAKVRRVQVALARKLGVSVAEAFPESQRQEQAVA